MSTTTAIAASRKLKWHPTPPPPPTPKILNFPRRIRHRKHPKKPTKKPTCSAISTNSLKNYYHSSSLLDYSSIDRKGKLERLFGEEEHDYNFSRSDFSVPIVLLNSSCGGRRGREENEVEEAGEEKWKFQAEMLRAECNVLRKERELAMKKLEKNKIQMQRTLRSAVHTLISGRKKIIEGGNVNGVLEEEIEDLADKLAELLQRNSAGIKDFEVRKGSNFDKQACHLQRRLEKIGGGISDDKCSNDLQELAEASCVSGPINRNKSTDVEVLGRKMEGLSKEMWDKLEEDFGSMCSNTANSSVASSASTSKRIECPSESTFSSRLYQDTMQLQQEDGKCSGRCKAIVRKIVEQVRGETEQWSQMQIMLGKVREEMEELQASRNFWEDQALNSDNEIKHLQTSVQEWKEKALNYEIKADEMQKELSALRGELEKLKAAECNEKSKQLGKENYTAFYHHLKENLQTNDKECSSKENVKKTAITQVNIDKGVQQQQPISLGKQLEKEKRLLMQRLNERKHHQANDKNRKQDIDCRKVKSHTCNNSTSKRSPFRDIGNSSSSPLMKQSSRTIFPLHS